MALVWKVLAALFLVLPVAAYVTGTLVGPYDTPAPREPVVSPSVPTSGTPGSLGPTGAPEGAGAWDVDGWSRVGGAGADPSVVEPSQTDADETTADAAPRQPRRETQSDRPGGGTTAAPSDGATESTTPSPSPTPTGSPTQTPDETPTETPDSSASRTADGSDTGPAS
jgi:hypothetical protein